VTLPSVKTLHTGRSDPHEKEPQAGRSRRQAEGQDPAYPAEFRLRVVRLSLEEGCSTAMLCEQFGINLSMGMKICQWE